MATKKPINQPKINPKQKFFSSSDLIVLSVFKVKKKKKTHKCNPLIIWNLLTQKSTVLVAEIFFNDYFLSLS
jgi:hypothetical protein